MWSGRMNLGEQQMKETLTYNAQDIEEELAWFVQILKTRSRLNAREECEYRDVFELQPPEHRGGSLFSTFIQERGLGFTERFMLILAMVPHIRPEVLDVFLARNRKTQRIFTEFGGRKGAHHSGFLPTGETALFILAGRDLARRFDVQRVFNSSPIFSKMNLLWLDEVAKGEPALSGTLNISKELLDRFTLGEVQKPTFGTAFPARRLTTEMNWSDLVLPAHLMDQLREIETWILHRKTLMEEWGMKKYLKPGYKTLFHGPPGTGKTLTASLLGKKTGRDVYRIDLSQTVSKYIGETEKNLARVFDRAENKEWILFFDEADALFGNRTSTKDAHDRYANQQVSYLLQRIEEHDGLMILASNLLPNIDHAFLRRLQSMIHFPVPDAAERLKLWREGFRDRVTLKEEIDLKKIAREYEIAGGTIINVIQHCMLNALERENREVVLDDIMNGIKREFQKNRRTI